MKMKDLNVGSPIDMNVYYREGDILYQCFTHKTREELGGLEVLTKLFEKSKVDKFSFTLINDNQVTGLKSLIQHENASTILNFEAVNFHYRYGLLDEADFKKFEYNYLMSNADPEIKKIISTPAGSEFLRKMVTTPRKYNTSIVLNDGQNKDNC